MGAPAGHGPKAESDLLGNIEAVSAWCQGVRSAIPLPIALRKLAERLNVEIAAVTRVDHVNSAKSRAAKSSQTRMVAFDARSNMADDITGFRTSYAAAVCGDYLSSSKLGSIWHARIGEFAGSLRLTSPLTQRRLIETVVIPLEHHATSSDFLELHSARELDVAFLDRLGLVAPTLVESWRRRDFGILSQNALASSQESDIAEDEPKEPVLGMGNSYGLSRAEYRICLLMSRGLNNSALLEELSISRSTLRTHLRNIYAKTGTSSGAELVQRLLVPVTRMGQMTGSRYVA